MDGVTEVTEKICSDLTRKLLFKYFRGNSYIMVIYNYDSNSILTEAIKDLEGKSIVNAYETLYNRLTTNGLKQRFQKPENKYSNILIKSLQDENLDFQLVPPNIHRRNAAEQMFQKFRNHLIAGLCSVNTYLPLKMWGIFLDQ